MRNFTLPPSATNLERARLRIFETFDPQAHNVRPSTRLPALVTSTGELAYVTPVRLLRFGADPVNYIQVQVVPVLRDVFFKMTDLIVAYAIIMLILQVSGIMNILDYGIALTDDDIVILNLKMKMILGITYLFATSVVIWRFSMLFINKI